MGRIVIMNRTGHDTKRRQTKLESNRRYMDTERSVILNV